MRRSVLCVVIKIYQIFLVLPKQRKGGAFLKGRVQIFCSQGRVNGAMKVGLVWIIPATAEKPQDPRKKIQNF